MKQKKKTWLLSSPVRIGLRKLTQVLHEVLQGVEGFGDVANLGLTHGGEVPQQQRHQIPTVLVYFRLRNQSETSRHPDKKTLGANRWEP